MAPPQPVVIVDDLRAIPPVVPAAAHLAPPAPGPARRRWSLSETTRRAALTAASSLRSHGARPRDRTHHHGHPSRTQASSSSAAGASSAPIRGLNAVDAAAIGPPTGWRDSKYPIFARGQGETPPMRSRKPDLDFYPVLREPGAVKEDGTAVSRGMPLLPS